MVRTNGEEDIAFIYEDSDDPFSVIEDKIPDADSLGYNRLCPA